MAITSVLRLHTSHLECVNTCYFERQNETKLQIIEM